MSDFERQLPAFRLVETHHGDDLQSVAARELGDANRWAELVWINGLVHPYITDDEARVTDGVLLSGQFIKVPAAAGVYTDAAQKGQVYERDCAMVGRQLQDDGAGDFAILTGVDNLRQQLQHRIDTPRGQARRHPEYGCLIYRLLGKINGPTASMLGGQYVKSAAEADYRVKSVDYAKATVVGDSVKIEARAIAIEGGAVDIVKG